MNPQRRRRIILISGLALFGLVALALILKTFWTDYRSYSNAAAAELLGLVHETAPTLDTRELVDTLRRPDPTSSAYASGQAILESYGLLPDDFASPVPAQLLFRLATALVLLIASLLAAVFVYQLWLDHRLRQKLRQLVRYLQDLNHKVYDLRLDENDESEFSLLTNELYKITVMLKESADTNYQNRKHLETALADISHQLRTPLTSIQVLTENMRHDPDMSAATRHDFLTSISHQIDTMSSLITTLLYLAQFDNGSITLQPTVITAGELLRPLIADLAVLAELAEVDLELSGDLSACIALDTTWQSQALSNLLKNAIEHSPADANVLVQVENCPLFLRIKIHNSGPEISPHDLKHIFERFYRVDGSHTDGVGIGLAFAKTIIEAESGQISAHSAPNQGTTFTVTYFHA